jgi:hypothetical protein
MKSSTVWKREGEGNWEYNGEGELVKLHCILYRITTMESLVILMHDKLKIKLKLKRKYVNGR